MALFLTVRRFILWPLSNLHSAVPDCREIYMAVCNYITGIIFFNGLIVGTLTAGGPGLYGKMVPYLVGKVVL